MFNLREFLMIGFKDAIGKMADYQIILNANGYYEKGVLVEEDLVELQRLIEEKNMPVVEEVIEEPVEEETEQIDTEVNSTEQIEENTAESAENSTENSAESEEE